MPEEQSVLRGEKPYYKDYFSGPFNGEVNLGGLAESHFKDFELYYNAYGATLFADISTLFRRTISGKVKLWFDQIEFDSVNTLKIEFLKKFGKSKTQQHHVKTFYNPKLEEGEDINVYVHRLKEAGLALGVTGEDKIKDSFLRGLPSHLFALVAGSRQQSLSQLSILAGTHLDFFRESKGAVGFDLGECNISEQSSAKKFLQEEIEKGLVRQVTELSQELEGLKSQLSTRGGRSGESNSDDECSPNEECEGINIAEARGRTRYKPQYSKPYRQPHPSSRDSYPNRDRYPSRDRYSGREDRPSREYYTNRARYPSRERYHPRRSLSRDGGRSRENFDPYPYRDSPRDFLRPSDWDRPRWEDTQRSYVPSGPSFGPSQGEMSFRSAENFNQFRQGSYPRQPRQIRCDRCGGLGHIARRCTAQMSEQDFQ